MNELFTFKQQILSKLLQIDLVDQHQIKELHRRFASFLIVLSGLILYLDKLFLFFQIEFEMPQKFVNVGQDFSTFLWLLMQTISPVLLIIGSIFRPYFIFYIIPVYCYFLQLYFVLFDYRIIDDHYLNAYVIGSSLLTFIAIFVLKSWLNQLFKNKMKTIKNIIVAHSENES